MAEQDHNTIFRDTDTGPNRPDDPRRPDERVEEKDLRINDEDTEPGRLRSDRPDRPSTADDMSNPRTGPIG